MLSNDAFLMITLTGFVAMIVGLFIAHMAVYKMINAINKDRTAIQQVPKWHAFIRGYQGDAIALYRASFNGGSLYKLLKLSWVFLIVGFVMVIGSHFMAP